MKKILMVSYISKEVEGRLCRCFDALNTNKNIYLILIQGCINEIEKSEDKNVINIIHTNGIKGYIDFIKTAKATIKKIKFDLIYLHDYRTAVFGIGVKGRKIIYDAYELLYPQSGLRFRTREWIYYILEKYIICKSRLVVAANKERAYVMIGRYKLRYIPIVIENIPDKINKSVKNLSQREFSIVYAGYINENNGIDRLVEAVAKYNQRAEKSLKIHLYGKWMLHSDISEYEKSGVIYHGSYKLEELNSIMQRYIFGYLSYRNENLDTILCAPNKYYDYINNGNVIICNDNYLMKERVLKQRVGYAGSNLDYVIADAISNYEEYFKNIAKCRNELNSSSQFLELIKYILDSNDEMISF